MASYVLSDRARADLKSIRDKIAERRPKVAREVLSKIERAMELLASMPTLGSPNELLPIPHLRSWTVVKRYVIYYLSDTDPLQVVRVVSGDRDVHQLEWID